MNKYKNTKAIIIFSIVILYSTKIFSTIRMVKEYTPKKIYPIIELKNINKTFNEDTSTFLDILHLYKNKNIQSFLDTLAITEGTLNHKYTQKKKYLVDPIDTNQYKICFTNKVFESFTEHPNIKYSANGLCSSASGRYQFLKKTWDEILRILSLNKISPEVEKKIKSIYRNHIPKRYLNYKKIYPNHTSLYSLSFGPFLQDIGAIYLIYRANAIEDILENRIDKALPKVAPIWASIPEDRDNISYYEGQSAFKFRRIEDIFFNLLQQKKNIKKGEKNEIK